MIKVITTVIASSLVLATYVTTAYGWVANSNMRVTWEASKQQQTHSLRMRSSGSHSSDDIEGPTVCILGGGFGGLYCALALSAMSENDPQSPRPRIKLLDKKERFVFLPLLYELCVGDATIDEVAPTYESLLQGTNIEFIQTNVTGFDIEEKSLLTGSGDDKEISHTYDSLVIATGTEATFNDVPGATGYALPFYTVEDCYELRRRLSVLDLRNVHKDNQSIDVVIVGAGYSGVELALNIGQRLRESQDNQVNVHLIHRGKEIMPSASEYNRQSSLTGLNEANVTIWTQTSVVEVRGNELDDTKQVVLKNSSGNISTINSDLLLWTAGSKPSESVASSNFVVDKMGRIVTGSTLRVKGTNDVFAIGDCSRAALKPYPATAQVAMQQAQITAYNVLSVLDEGSRRKAKLLPFKYADLGEMMTLGSYDATINSLGGLVKLRGPSARCVISFLLFHGKYSTYISLFINNGSVLRRLIYSIRMPTTTQAITAALSSSLSRVSKKASKTKVQD